MEKNFSFGVAFGLVFGILITSLDSYNENNRLAKHWEATAGYIEQWKKEGTDNGMRDGATLWRHAAKELRSRW
jgi:hypothetical protein